MSHAAAGPGFQGNRSFYTLREANAQITPFRGIPALPSTRSRGMLRRSLPQANLLACVRCKQAVLLFLRVLGVCRALARWRGRWLTESRLYRNVL